MVISTGTIDPRWLSVAALYCLQKSMVCTPCGPRAVPTGGAGVAPPAGSWILTTAMTRFFGGIGASLYLGLPGNPPGLQLGDLAEFEFYGGLSTEDVDEDLELELVLVDLGDLSGEVGERPFLDPHRLTDLVLEPGPAALGRSLPALDLDLQDAFDLTAGQRGGLGAGTDEPGDPGRVPDDRPAVVVQLAAAQQVAREHLLLDHHLLAVLELDDILHRDDHLVDAVLHVHRHGPAVEVGLHLVLIAGVGVDDEPPTRLVVGTDHEGLVVVPVVIVVLEPDIDPAVGLEVRLGLRFLHHFRQVSGGAD